jgi:hypothetical protein
MRYIIILLTILLVFGCTGSPVELPSLPSEPQDTQQSEEVCRTVTEMVPAQVEECGEVAYTEEECGKRTLNFTSEVAPTTHLCMIDGDCGGKPISECTACAKAATRCTMTITNDDEKKSGVWSVASNFTLGNSVFVRDPVTKTIDPGESEEFDFQHFYVPGFPINTATCQVFLMEEAEVDDCIQVTHTREECYNVTKQVSVDREVCE